MSHIDSFKHEIVGLFGCLPVYHPLQKIDGDFQCDENQLILGGGSGEHPALIVKDLLSAVSWFLDDELDSVDTDDVNHRDYPLKKYVSDWRAVIEEHVKWDLKDNLEFSEWSVETYSQFYKLCLSKSLPNPYNEKLEKFFESWLIKGFGEFVFFAMPHLVPEIINRLDNPYKYFNHMRYNNIMVIPKNIPVYANGGNAFKFK